MKTNYIFMSMIIFLAFSCKKSDDSLPPDIELQNGPPLSFSLMEMPDGATDVGLTPTLSWESAKNLKGGEVLYNPYLDKKTNPKTVYQSDISGTSLQITDRLNILTDYYWKVVATDTEGQSSQSVIHSFTTRDFQIPNSPIVESAEFSGRFGHTTVAFNEKLWVIGARSGGFLNDIWQSADGLTWEQLPTENHFSGRGNHASAVFDGKLWVVGGQTNLPPETSKKASYLSNEVWYTENGSDWMLASDNPPFSERSNHTLTVFNNTLWLIGGSGEFGSLTDIWKSTDGFNWVEVTPGAPFSHRSRHSTIVFDNKIWLIGGNDFSTEDPFWFSEDGENWKKAPYPPQLNAVRGHTTCVFDNRLWIFGGYSGLDNIIEEAWYTTDGNLWSELDKEIPFLGRSSHTTTVFENKILTVAGAAITESSSIWNSQIWVME